MTAADLLSSDPLAAAPALAFFTVAAADGSLDAAEVARFRTQLTAGREYGALFAAALGRLSAGSGTLDAAVDAASEAVLTGEAGAAWQAVREALSGEDADESQRFAADTVDFARSIAEAAGGLHGVGPQVSPEEAAAVDAIAAALA